MIHELDIVVLTRDIGEYGLKKGEQYDNSKGKN